MKRQGNVLRRLTNNVNALGQPLPGVPLVEIAGHSRVLIENHQGVTEYGHERICVRVKYGKLYISGAKLELALMSQQQLVITGSIDSVSIERRGV